MILPVGKASALFQTHMIIGFFPPSLDKIILNDLSH